MNGPWEQMLGAAIAGTRRREHEVAASAAALGLTGTHADPSAPDVIAVLAAGRLAAPAATRPQLVPPPPFRDDRPVIPPEVLERAGDDAQLLAEVLDLAVGYGLAAPAVAVPRLLDAAARGRLRRDHIRTVTGPGGRYLAELNPDWSLPEAFQVAPADDHGWLDPDPDTRIGWLAAVRADDPARARPYLERALAPRPEKPDFKTRVLHLLGRDEHEDEADLLEAALDARAEAVRSTAQQVLATRRTPSPYQQRMRQRVAEWLRPVWDGDVLDVHVQAPADLPADAARDGLTLPTEPAVPQRARAPHRRSAGGYQAVVCLVRPVPLAGWGHLGTPTRLVAGLARSRTWAAAAVLDGLRQRLDSEPDPAWIRALFDAGLASPGLCAGVIPAAESAVRTRWAVDQLRQERPDARATDWVRDLTFPLPADAAGAVIDALPVLTRLNDRSALSRVIEGFSYRQDPGWAARLRAVLPDLPPTMGQHIERAAARQQQRAWIRARLAAAAGTGPAGVHTPEHGEPSEVGHE